MHAPVLTAHLLGCHDMTTRSWRGQLQLDDMGIVKTNNRQGQPEWEASEFGVVRVISRPVPNAEDRLCRLFNLLLEHLATARQATTEKDSLPNARPTGNRLGAQS